MLAQRLLRRRFNTDHLIDVILDDAWRIEEKIGEGGMSYVFRGTRLSDGEPVAIKVLKTAMRDSEADALRFEREIELLSGVRHVNVLELYAAATLPTGETAIVTELLHGRPLSALLKGDQRLSMHHALPIMRQTLTALHHVHSAFIVHRDLKPGNIFLARNANGTGQVKLIDFGLGMRPESDDIRLTRAGCVAGTPGYTSPEQVLNKEITPRADLYALGILMFRTLTGTLPIQEKSVGRTLLAHIHTIPTAPDWSSVGVPWAVGELIMQCLAKDPNDRPLSAWALSQSLRAALSPG